jgi:hypothetical protein
MMSELSYAQLVQAVMDGEVPLHPEPYHRLSCGMAAAVVAASQPGSWWQRYDQYYPLVAGLGGDSARGYAAGWCILLNWTPRMLFAWVGGDHREATI